MLIRREKLPQEMRNDYVEKYLEILEHKKASLVLKRVFDIVISLMMILLFSPVLLIVSIIIKLDSEGPIIYKQERVTQYGRVFKVFKFRTMVSNADKIGAHVTRDNDSRITNVGKKIRGSRLDELPQIFNVLMGDMSFVGTRPEAVRYVKVYSEEMYATLLLPAGITSKASIMFKDEAKLLDGEEDVDKAYLEKVLPEKMKYNLKAIEEFGFINDIKIMFQTALAVIR